MSSSLAGLRATAHPVRLRLLSLLTSTALSAAEAGRELHISQALASYHMRVLERVGLIEVVDIVRVRGGAAKRYRHMRSSEPVKIGDERAGARKRAAREEQAAYLRLLADEMVRRAGEQATGPSLTTDAELWVDARIWRRVVQASAEASRALHIAAQPPRTPGTVPVSMSVAMFPLRHR